MSYVEKLRDLTLGEVDLDKVLATAYGYLDPEGFLDPKARDKIEANAARLAEVGGGALVAAAANLLDARELGARKVLEDARTITHLERLELQRNGATTLYAEEAQRRRQASEVLILLKSIGAVALKAIVTAAFSL
jgi:hypothetical protein